MRIHARQAMASVALAIALASGCGEQTPRAAPAVAPTVAPTEAPQANPPQAVDSEPSAGPAATPPGDTTSGDVSSASSAEKEVAQAGSTPVDLSTKKDRWAILAAGGPLVCDVALAIDGSSEKAVLKMRSQRDFAPQPALRSRLWPIFDVDQSGWLSRSEIDDAPRQLLRYDNDDDHILVPQELRSLQEMLDQSAGMSGSMRREAARLAVLHLNGPPSDAEQWDYLLTDLYAPRQSLRADSFSEAKELFAELDADRDGGLTTHEVALLSTVTPHGIVSVEFAATDAQSGGPASLTWQSKSSGSVGAGQSEGDSAVVCMGRTKLLFVARDATSAQMSREDASPQVAEASKGDASDESPQTPPIHVFVHDECDAIFFEMDLNHDGVLGEREIDQCRACLLACDANQDGRVEGAEIPYWLIVAIVRGMPNQSQTLYQPPPKLVPHSGDENAWFRSADFNGDGEISRREFLGGAEKFQQLDANQDGFLNVSEAE